MKLLLKRFEACLKKMYFIANNRELTREDGGYVQFLEAARAVGVDRLHSTDDPKLIDFKTYYEFVHARRNAESHSAPVIDNAQVLPGIHMATAMYLYATMIYITDMESGEHVCMYPCDDDSDIGSSMVAEPNM